MNYRQLTGQTVMDPAGVHQGQSWKSWQPPVADDNIGDCRRMGQAHVTRPLFSCVLAGRFSAGIQRPRRQFVCQFFHCGA